MSEGAKSAFVVWVDPGSGAGPGSSSAAAGTTPELRGRVEHVASATRERFASRDDLLAFIERMLPRAGGRAPGTGDGGG